MKTSSPDTLAVLVSIGISFVVGGLLVCSIFVEPSLWWTYVVFVVLLIFVVTYIVTYYLFHNYIVSKIKPIYDTINDLKLTNKEWYDSFDKKDIILEINREVVEWVNNKTEEIKQLKDSERFRKEFVANVAHELKTPVFNIQGYVLTLLDGGMEDENINMRYLERTSKNIDRLIATIKDIDTISRIESGELKLEYEQFDVLVLVREIVDIQDFKSTKHKIKLSILDENREHLLVFADKKRIYEVLNNLILNSVQYGKEGGETKISFTETANKVWVKVADNGIGIEENHLAHIFKRFYRVDKSRSRETGGTGLGLAIVKHVIEAHNQTIKVESVVNEGTTFEFSIRKL